MRTSRSAYCLGLWLSSLLIHLPGFASDHVTFDIESEHYRIQTSQLQSHGSAALLERGISLGVWSKDPEPPKDPKTDKAEDWLKKLQEAARKRDGAIRDAIRLAGDRDAKQAPKALPQGAVAGPSALVPGGGKLNITQFQACVSESLRLLKLIKFEQSFGNQTSPALQRMVDTLSLARFGAEGPANTGILCGFHLGKFAVDSLSFHDELKLLVTLSRRKSDADWRQLLSIWIAVHHSKSPVYSHAVLAKAQQKLFLAAYLDPEKPLAPTVSYIEPVLFAPNVTFLANDKDQLMRAVDGFFKDEN